MTARSSFHSPSETTNETNIMATKETIEAAPIKGRYVVQCKGPIQVGNLEYYRTAVVPLTEEQAALINKQFAASDAEGNPLPAAVKFIGI